MRATLVLLLASLLPAQAPEQDVLAMIATAERRLAKQAPDEETTLLLWQLEQQVSAMTRTVARDAALATVQTLLAKADASAAERTRVLADAAKKFIEVAVLYRQRKWYELAEDRLRVAASFDDAAAQKELQALEAARAKEPGYKPPPKPEPVPVPGPLISRLKATDKSGDWVVDGEQLVGPKESKKEGVDRYTTNTTHADAELSVEILITDDQGLASFCYGITSVDDQFRVSLQRDGRDSWRLRTESYTASEPKGIHEYADGRLLPSPDGWHRLVVRVRDKTADITVDGGAMKSRVELSRPAHGALGFLIFGLGEKTPIRFRNLVIGPLPEKADDAADRAAAQSTLRKGVMATVERGEKLLAEKKTEAGVLALRQAWADVRRLEAGSLRDNLDASIEKLLVKADPVHAKRKKAAQDVAALYAALVARYQATTFLRCALECARSAMSFDSVAHTTLVQKCEEAVAARDAAEAVAQAQELQPPKVDNAELNALFGKGRLLWSGSRAWVVDATSARAQQLVDGEITVLTAPNMPPAGGSFAVHLHLSGPGAAGGFAFDALGDNEFGVAVLHRAKGKLILGLHRFSRGTWQVLGRVTVPVPQWRTAGWFELRIEDLADKVKVAVGDVELVAERGKLAKMGPIGLIAEVVGSTGPVDVEMRGFRKLEPAVK